DLMPACQSEAFPRPLSGQPFFLARRLGITAHYPDAALAACASASARCIDQNADIPEKLQQVGSPVRHYSPDISFVMYIHPVFHHKPPKAVRISPGRLSLPQLPPVVPPASFRIYDSTPYRWQG